ncbi:MAG: sel1 repeat family protein [Ruminococcaceae bacterium]|nr:sel1 repeat family protein [Oscillospiraceae bacterium]MBE7008459.1 sel1 repeat family protein [Oscillospiraceae bacterium]
MARFIFISPYLKGGKDAAKLSHRTRYIATREGVELLRSDNADLAPSDKQESFIDRALRQFPEAKELLEYEDYRAAPTRKTASALIEQLWEQYVMTLEGRENFLDYVSHRPGVRSDGDHGLWDANGKVENLSAVVREVANHQGNVWTPVVSMRREDAERLGFTDAENWRAAVNACVNEIAEGYKIAPNHLRWYAALHEKEKHVHIHMVVYSTDPKEGYLTKEGIRRVKSAFARRLFEQDLICVYKRQTEYRNTLQEEAEARMRALIERMGGETIRSDRLEMLTDELAERLRDVKGKKVYGYLPPATKRIVDAIVDEISRDERVAEAYSLWQEMRDEVCRTYSSALPERKPLSQQKEFKPVRNMVIREALQLSERPAAFDDERMDDEPEDAEEQYIDAPPVLPKASPVYEKAERYRRAKNILYDETADRDAKRDAVAALEKLWGEGYAVAAHQLGKCCRDGVGVERNADAAEAWFRRAAARELDCSEYALGKLLLEQGRSAEGIGWLEKAAERENQYAQYRLGKVYLMGEQTAKDVDAAISYLGRAAERGNQYAQYALGKLYLMGRDVPQDMERAIQYLTRSAAQGNTYAQYFLDHRNDWQHASTGAAVLRMLHHMSRIFADNAVTDSTYMGLQIDRKRRQKMQDKRIAMGHKADDHEDHVQHQQRM